jgi:carboxylesterase
MLSNEPFLLEGSRDEACLLLHGLGGGSFEMQLLGEALHRQGYTVQTINYPGHDRPAAIMPASRWEEWYAHVEEAWHDLRRRYARISVVGFSTGSLLGLHLAAQHPVHHLIALSPFLAVRHQWYYVLRPERFLFSIGHLVPFVPKLPAPLKDPEMRRHAANASYFRTFSLSSARSAVALIREVKSELSRVHCPILIIQSPHDRVVDPEGAEYLYREIGARIKKMHWLRRSDHIITLDVEREEVFARIGEFLEAGHPVQAEAS